MLVADPRVLAVPVHDSGEPLVALPADVAGLHLAVPQCFVRQTVSDKLVAATSMLPDGYALKVVEGYRPIELQARLFEEYRAVLIGLYPGEPSDRIYELTARLVAPPDASTPHGSGSAVDITLTDPTGSAVDMGTEIDATPEDSNCACYTAAANLGPEARRHRAILGDALTKVGMVNYPTEWWHWSYGDQYWAYMTSTPAAIYGNEIPRRQLSSER